MALDRSHSALSAGLRVDLVQRAQSGTSYAGDEPAHSRRHRHHPAHRAGERADGYVSPDRGPGAAGCWRSAVAASIEGMVVSQAGGSMILEAGAPMELIENRLLDGPQLFARYAFMPNRLAYCGPDENRALFDYCIAGLTDGGLRGLLRKFTGAMPYLQLIAECNAIPDPLDGRVVEAYWLGNELLQGVEVRALYNSL